MLQDPIAQQIEPYIGRMLRMNVGKQTYLGRIVSVTDQIVELVSGADPVNIALRTDAIDSVMAFVNEKE